MNRTVFISYSHQDMAPTHWLERLKVYLAPARRQTGVDIWDDTRIATGEAWLHEIDQAIERASVAILLVGPGFFASDFIDARELPPLLSAARSNRIKIYPLVLGYCGYRRSSLGQFQAFNDPEKPLEAHTLADQNKILNDLSLLVDEQLRQASIVSRSETSQERVAVRDAMSSIHRQLHATSAAFVAQCGRRDNLVKRMSQRLKIINRLEYEKFFFRYFARMNREEKFDFDQIRAVTEGSLYQGNRAILEIFQKHPSVFDELPRLAHLQQHLVFWVNKFEKVFTRTPEMCVLYAGVEDGVPFPSGMDQEVADWLEAPPKKKQWFEEEGPTQARTQVRTRTAEALARYPLPQTRSDDFQKSRWGGKANADGRRLTAHVVKLGKKSYEITLRVSSTDGSPMSGPVRFHLHKGSIGGFGRSPISIRRCNPDAVLDELFAYAPFTVGVEVLRADGVRTVLELDLEAAFERADRAART